MNILKIEQKALERYPIKIMNNGTNQWDSNHKLRTGYKEGYRQALEDVYRYLKSTNAIENTYTEFANNFIIYNE